MKKLRSYTQTFKEDAVRLALTGDKSIDATAKNLGVPSATLHGWIAVHRKHSSKNLHQTQDLTEKFFEIPVFPRKGRRNSY